MQRITKKDLALSLHAAGRTVKEIAKARETHPSYIANVLAAAGKTPDYNDLYTSTTSLPGPARMFQGVLRFRDVQSARESVEKIDELYREFQAAGDRRGQHQAQVMALTGKNRAEGIGKYEEAEIFAGWLMDHLEVERVAPPRRMGSFDDEDSLFAGTFALAS